MAKRKQTRARLYWRTRSDSAPRAWGDFREYAEQGGKREPLVTPAWITATGVFLGRAVTFFGAERRLGAITPDHVVEWIAWLREVKTPRGRPLSEQSIRHHLNSLSKLYRRAQRRHYVAEGYNPVRTLTPEERPVVPESSTRCLEVPQAAFLLEMARIYPAKKNEPEMALAYPLIATFLLTGGRAKEVLGLRVEDVSTSRKTVSFRPNEFHEGRRLKTKGSTRTVPLWPQLAEILTPLLDERAIEGGRLLFRSPHITDREVALTDLRDLLDRVGRRAGWQDGEIRTRPFRVTYATARLQTLDHGAPVSPWTVEKELGHGSRDMLEEVYGRLPDVRHRSESVEYRIEQHFDWKGGEWVPKSQSAPIIRTISPAA